MTAAIIKNKRSQVLFRLRLPRRDVQVVCDLTATILPKTDLRAKVTQFKTILAAVLPISVVQASVSSPATVKGSVTVVSPLKAKIEVCK